MLPASFFVLFAILLTASVAMASTTTSTVDLALSAAKIGRPSVAHRRNMLENLMRSEEAARMATYPSFALQETALVKASVAWPLAKAVAAKKLQATAQQKKTGCFTVCDEVTGEWVNVLF